MESNDGTRLHPSFWTWRFPTKMHFAPNSIPRHHGQQRRPIPFGTSVSKQQFTRLGSMEKLSVPYEQVTAAAVASQSTPALPLSTNRHVSLSIAPLPSVAAMEDEKDTEDVAVDAPRKLVTPHAKHPPWDDESNLDHPYENPYYVREITNVLWLPRNPCGILNLDETVDLHKSLTSEPVAGALGAWGEPTEMTTEMSMLTSMGWISEIGESEDGHEYSEPVLVESPGEIQTFGAEGITGEEEIDVSPVIAARAKAGDDVEEAAPEHKKSIRSRRSTSRRRGSVSGVLALPHSPVQATLPLPSTGPRRPSTAPRATAPTSGYRSFSSGSSRLSARRTSSHFSDREHRRPTASSAIDPEFGGRRPGPVTQASFTRSALSVVNSTSSRLAAHALSTGQPTIRLVTHDRNATMHVSTHEAVVHEVIAEETVAAEERHKEEEAEEEKATRKAPWWKAWMFTSTQAPPSSAPRTP
jgi:hypothetical protein